ncbi:MAG: DUF6688 family protein [Anaerolineales bacterium]
MNDNPNTPVPSAWPGRVLYGLITILLPIASFALAFDGGLGPEWQSGQISDYAMLMLHGPVSLYFSPFLAYAMLSMLLLLIAPGRFSSRFAVRFGIYTGALLALQYLLLLSIAFPPGLIFMGASVSLAVGLPWVYAKLTARFGAATTWAILIGVFVALVVGWGLYTGDIIYSVIANLPSMVIITMLASGPAWCLLIAARVSLRLMRKHEVPRSALAPAGIGVAVWLIGWISAWRLAIAKALEVYAALPTSPPECYIATAAAHGHPHFVKSERIIDARGRTMWINPQVRYLKCAELALRAVWPAAHRLGRRMYDCVGARLAWRITHPLVADAVYLTLKPLEWSTRAILKLLYPEVVNIAARFYADGG